MPGKQDLADRRSARTLIRGAPLRQMLKTFDQLSPNFPLLLFHLYLPVAATPCRSRFVLIQLNIRLYQGAMPPVPVLYTYSLPPMLGFACVRARS
jgi:hypothetical protein